ncbi:site-specific DNA-methyltransferase [Dehalococcoides mccartyi]|uniref:site-specific DNA-methyltransferase n=1 Tax=Dehalococcoides mccartyi TaxID=61435 RepID=UPI0002B76C27|nr:site-specific DNA-methyltransferase [Dehalococcoides mccartyi]AGG07269.1 type III restriction-modification protein, methylation subunit [Dehalococcoides mccartyi BTF08]AOV98757.1 type III restriction-modification system methylation subunit [Dehalococcoides mccartyi]AQU05423.1 site-specific DNA-methyltransferase [Dehalococcoides mccartyi]
MKKITDQDPESKSRDIVSENIEQLKVIFPEAFTEDKIDFEALKQLLGGAVNEREEKYGLNWHGKRSARLIALTPSTGTLRPRPEDSVDWDITQNLMIEGDNLEVLKLLQKSYAGKIKMIYIDPPYNTGGDFVYPDDFKDNIKNYLMRTGQMESDGRKNSSNTESSGRLHTDWLNMMYPRLRLARNLLSDTGVICVSIGDEELYNLKFIMNEVFGEENFRNTIALRRYDKNLSRQFMEFGLNSLSVGFEYILVYCKSSNATLNPIFREASEERQVSGYWKGFWNAPDRPTMRYSLLGVTPQSGQWKWKEETALESVVNYQEFIDRYSGSETLEAYWERTGKIKKFIRRNPAGQGANKGVEHWIPPSDGILRSSNWTDLLASSPLTALGIPFENPKSVDMLQLLIQFTTDDGDIILDFFAGSGTTGHAVMNQNVTDSGNKRYILVQLPEMLDPDNKDQKLVSDFCDQIGKPRNIAEMCKERLRRAGKKIKEEHPMFTGDIGFRVFKLDSSNIRAWEPDRDNLAATLDQHAEHLKVDRTEQDILYELLLKLGLDLTVPMQQKTITGKTVHSIGAGTLLVCLATEITTAEVEPLALGIVKWYKQLAPAGETQVVFRDSAFADDVAKTNLTAILEQYGLENVRSI